MREEEERGEKMPKDKLLQKYQLKKLTFGTIYSWMELFGFIYSSQKKTCYVDGHEHPSTVDYCKKICKPIPYGQSLLPLMDPTTFRRSRRVRKET